MVILDYRDSIMGKFSRKILDEIRVSYLIFKRSAPNPYPRNSGATLSPTAYKYLSTP